MCYGPWKYLMAAKRLGRNDAAHWKGARAAHLPCSCSMWGLRIDKILPNAHFLLLVELAPPPVLEPVLDDLHGCKDLLCNEWPIRRWL